MKNNNVKLGLDHVSLVKPIPIGIGLNVFANIFMGINVGDILYYAAFLLIFSFISYDSIIEFGRYDYYKMPLKFKILSFINGVILLLLIFSIASFSNKNFNEFSILFILITLSLSSLLEIFFSYFLGKALKHKKIEPRQTDYDIKDTKLYCLWEILFTGGYVLLIYFHLTISNQYKDLMILYIALAILLMEISLFKHFKGDNQGIQQIRNR